MAVEFMDGKPKEKEKQLTQYSHLYPRVNGRFHNAVVGIQVGKAPCSNSI